MNSKQLSLQELLEKLEIEKKQKLADFYLNGQGIPLPWEEEEYIKIKNDN